MEKVVDIHKKNGKRPYYDIYIGRKITAWGIKDFPENSKWANLYPIESFGKEISLKLYEEYIRKCIKKDPDYFNLKELEGMILGCWCINTTKINPVVCHGQILIKLLKEKRDKNK